MLGSSVGDFVLLGRKMVLKPRPVYVPAKAASGPRRGADTALALKVVPLDTSPYLKLACLDRAGSMFASLIAILQV